MSAPLLEVVERFIASCREPVLLEPGEEPIALEPGHFAVEESGGRVVVQAWDQERNLVRQVLEASSSTPGRLELRVQRFGKRAGSVLLLDRARAANASLDRRAARHVFRERFRRMVQRNFPAWPIAELSSDADLEHSLSPVYPRALLTRGSAAWAALAAPDDAAAAHHALSFGLIWLDYLRRRERRVLVEGLALFLPAGSEATSCLRIRCLHPRAARFSVFVYSGQEWEQQVDVNVQGNLDTRLEPADAEPARGHRSRPYPPEAELEMQLRGRIRAVDAMLLDEPIYGQVPALAGCERGIIDLLAVDRDGRLAVVELKATADLHLPLQALDYWIRVDWHQRRGEFGERGYFPGIRLAAEAPRLLLVAPALEFHPTTETILRYIAPQIEVERVGLALHWKKDVAVMFRLRGSQSP